ncbi:MAG: hypothetical protein KTR22_02005 [Flavobacteriaceae bacterium]|nr:hypothetical protein [Flavobacteriaceae bacterium]
MSTRPIVEAAIAAIEDNGNNTAVEVRDVLTKLLDYTENDEITTPPPLLPFAFATTGPIDDGRTGATLQYSFRGFEGMYANFTFQINIVDTSKQNIFTFEFLESHGEELLGILEAILPTDNMRFAMPIQVTTEVDGGTREFSFVIPVNIAFGEDEITDGGTTRTIRGVRFDMDWPSGEGEFPISNSVVYTSVSFHSDERIIDIDQ